MIDRIPLIGVGDMIEAIDGRSLLGARHYEVAKMLKELPTGRRFTLHLTEPLKAFGELGWGDLHEAGAGPCGANVELGQGWSPGGWGEGLSMAEVGAGPWGGAGTGWEGRGRAPSGALLGGEPWVLGAGGTERVKQPIEGPHPPNTWPWGCTAMQGQQMVL